MQCELPCRPHRSPSLRTHSLYGRDPVTDWSIPYGTGASLWGYVDPPTVERKAPGCDEWEPLRQCDVKEQQCTIDFISRTVAQCVPAAG